MTASFIVRPELFKDDESRQVFLKDFQDIVASDRVALFMRGSKSLGLVLPLRFMQRAVVEELSRSPQNLSLPVSETTLMGSVTPEVMDRAVKTAVVRWLMQHPDLAQILLQGV